MKKILTLFPQDHSNHELFEGDEKTRSVDDAFTIAFEEKRRPLAVSSSRKLISTQRPNRNEFVATAVTAFAEHRPLALSPDDFWTLILQGVSLHLNANPDLRGLMVSFEGKQTIKVYRDHEPRNGDEWNAIISEMASQARSCTDHPHLFTVDFSTSDDIDRAVRDMTILDCLKSFFSYELHTLCGVPYYIVEGTVEDWRKILDAFHQISNLLDLQFWEERLAPLLTHIIHFLEGHEPSKEFWDEFVKTSDGSGGPYIDGHILRLIPYLKSSRGEIWPMEGRASLATIPPGVTQTPFWWDAKGDMLFLGGFVGMDQDEQGVLHPARGWAVYSQE